MGKVRAPCQSHVPFERSEIEQSLARRFDHVAKTFPDRVAVRTPGGREVGYAELSERSNRIAHRLSEGNGPVALLLDSGVEMIAAMLGALRSARPFVALDPRYPVPRLALILEDSTASTLLTIREHEKVLAELGAGELDTVHLEDTDREPSESMDRSSDPDEVAYLVYTSGSTGRPKGVVHTHRGLLHAVMNYTNAFRIGSEDRMSLLHSPSFSSGIIDIFCALLNGASLHVWDFKARGFSGLADWLDELTIIDWVPTPFRHLVEVLDDRVLEGPRLLVLASEAVTRSEVEAYRRHFADHCVLVNRLGTTEVFNFRLFFLDKETNLDGATVPAGYPVPDKDVVLLDDKGHRIVEPGVVGEIAVRSPYIATGYWRRPELTAERFRSSGEARTYLTGDRGRLREDGCLEYLGRKDFQVKVRGFRIEPGEVEAALLADPAVVGAAVTAPPGPGGDRVLTAFLVGAGGVEPDLDELRRRLATHLPEHMVPTRFFVVETLPETPSGKIDRNALEVPDDGQATGVLEPPRGRTEELIAGMWRDLLGVEAVSRHDRFLDLGGHSLLVARLFERIERVFGRRLPLVTLIHAPTLARLAEAVEQWEEGRMWSPLVPIKPEGTKPPLFFVHAHGGNVVGYYDLARRLGDDQPFYGLQARGLEDSSEGGRNFREIAATYLAEVRRRQPQGPYLLGGWCWGGNLAYEMAQQLRAAGEEPALLVLVESTPHCYPRYESEAGRRASRLLDRLALERTLFLEASRGRKAAHVLSRLRRLLEMGGVWLEGAAWPLIRRVRPGARHSAAYHRHHLGVLHSMAFRSYRFDPYPGRILLLKARRQPSGTVPDELLGWEGLATGPLEVRTVPGPSIGMLSEPRVEVAAAHIEAGIDDALGSGSDS